MITDKQVQIMIEQLQKAFITKRVVEKQLRRVHQLEANAGVGKTQYNGFTKTRMEFLV